MGSSESGWEGVGHLRGLPEGGNAAAFIVGNDSDTVETVETIPNFAQDIRVDVMQLSLLTPFPGSRLYQRLSDEGWMLLDHYPDDWRYCDFAALAFETKLPASVVVQHCRELRQHELGLSETLSRHTPRLLERTIWRGPFATFDSILRDASNP